MQQRPQTSYSRNVTGGRSPSEHQHTTDRPQHRTFHPSRWPPHGGARERPHLMGWHAASKEHRPGFSSDTRRATTQARRAICTGQRCRTQGGGRNGPARNSSGAVAADPWCSELKLGGRWSQKTSTFVTRLAQPPPLLQTSLAAALISRGTALLSHAGRHARLRGQLARPRLFQPQERGRKRTLPQPGAPRHLSTPPIGPTEPKQPGNRPVQQSYCSEPCGEKTKTRKKHRQKQNQEIPTIVGLQHRPPNPHKFLSRHWH